MPNTATVLRPCSKCDGTGRINAFSHVASGTCFSCNGYGTIEVPADWEARAARAAKRRAAKEAARLAGGANDELWAEFTADFPVEAARIWELRSHPAYGHAYSAVATYKRCDSNRAHALDILSRASVAAS